MPKLISDLLTTFEWDTLAAAVVFAVLAPIAGGAAAQTSLDAIKAQKSVTLAIANEPPWMKLEPDGTATGVGPDLDRAVLEHIGVETMEAQVMEYGALIPAVQAKRVSMGTSGGLYITPERCEAVLFSEPVFCIGDGFVVRKELAESADPIDTYEEVAAQGLRLGVCTGCVYEKYAAEKGITEANTVRWPDGTSAMKMLQDGRIDVIVHDMVSAIDLQQKSSRQELTSVIVVKDRQAGCAGAVFHKENAELRDAYNEGLARIVENGTYEAILKKYGLGDLAKARQGSTSEFCSAG